MKPKLTFVLGIKPKDIFPPMITSPKEHCGSSIMRWCCFSSPGNGALIRVEGRMNFTFQHDNEPKLTSKISKGMALLKPDEGFGTDQI